jgi:hypothetical protein
VDTPWLGWKGASTMPKSHRLYPAEFRQRIIELVRIGPRSANSSCCSGVIRSPI